MSVYSERRALNLFLNFNNVFDDCTSNARAFHEMIARGKKLLKGEVRRKMNFIYVLGFLVLRDVVKVFPVSSPSFARKTTGRNRARSHSGA